LQQPYGTTGVMGVRN